MYCFDSRVRYSEVDYQGKITFNAILDYFQDCSSFQSEDMGIGVEYLYEKQVSWVLVSWQIEVKRYPALGENIQIGTWPYDFKGFYGYRNFLMTDAQGETLAYANSVWVLLDLQKGRPTKMLPEMVDSYVREPQIPMECEDRKMKLPENLQEQQPFEVHKFHLDTNQHVNNGKYILMAQEYLPPEFSITKMKAEYKKSAVYGDIIYPRVLLEKDKLVVALGDAQLKPYAIVELEGKNA